MLDRVKSSVPLLHDSAVQVALTVWTAFPITLEVSGERQEDAITELALKGTAAQARKRVLLISLIIICLGIICLSIKQIDLNVVVYIRSYSLKLIYIK